MPLFDPAIQILDQGVPLARPTIYHGSFVGPASYAAGGIPIDLSAYFDSILTVDANFRQFITATPATPTGLTVRAVEAGTDVFADGKFRLVVFGFSSDVIAGAGTVSLVNATETGAAASCIVGCAVNHAGAVVGQRTNLIRTATSVAKVSASLISGTAAGTVLNGITFEYLAYGSGL